MGKTAFVLSGGGFKGSFQAGVIHQLDRAGIKPDVVYGTSIGSTNAAGYAYLGAEKLIEYWLSLKSRGEALYPNNFQWAWAWTRIFKKTGLYSAEPLRKKLESFIKCAPQCESVACFVNLITGAAEYVSNKTASKEDYVRAIIASSSIPLLMEAIDDRLDGGIREQTPLAKAIDDGADKIYVILCSPIAKDTPFRWKKPKGLFPIVSVAARAVDDIMSHEIFINDLKVCSLINKYAQVMGKKFVELHIYAPDRVWIETLSFDKEQIKLAVEAGKTCPEWMGELP